MATPPSQNTSGLALRQLLASVAFLLSLFSLFCTLYTALLLWGATYARAQLEEALLRQIGDAPFDRYAGLLALKMAAGLASLFGIVLWNNRGAAKLALFRRLLMGDILSSVALLGFAYTCDRVGPVGYFRVLAFVSVGLILVWAGAGVAASAGRPAGPSGKG